MTHLAWFFAGSLMTYTVISLCIVSGESDEKLQQMKRIRELTALLEAARLELIQFEERSRIEREWNCQG